MQQGAVRQMTFDDIEVQEKQTSNKALAEALTGVLKDVAYRVDRKRLAAVNDLSYSYLSEILNSNGKGKPFQLDLIPSLITERPDDFMQIVGGFICELTGYEQPKKKSPLTPEEKIVLLEERIRSKGLESLFKDIIL